MTISGDQLRLTYKDHCKAATTEDHGLSGLSNVDDVSISDDDRILVKSQDTNSQNGIYNAHSGAWTRALDWNDVAQDFITYGINIFVQYGTLNANKTFRLTTAPSSIPGATVFTEAGSGTDNRIVRWNADGVSIQDSLSSIDDDGNLVLGDGNAAVGIMFTSDATPPLTPSTWEVLAWAKATYSGVTPDYKSLTFSTATYDYDVAIHGQFDRALLIGEQLSDGDILPAQVFTLGAQPTTGDVFALKIDTHIRVFGAGTGGDVQYTIGSTVAETLKNIADTITADYNGTDARCWKAVYFSNYGSYGIIVIYRTIRGKTHNTGGEIYGTFATAHGYAMDWGWREPGYIQFVYTSLTELPTSSPGLYFGFCELYDGIKPVGEPEISNRIVSTILDGSRIYGYQYGTHTWLRLDHYAPVKKPCRVATTGNIASLAGGAPLVVDGVTVNNEDRVLVWSQTTGAQNGFYRVATKGTGSDGTWKRAPDFDDETRDPVTAGLETYVQEGNSYSRTVFFLVTTGTITIGSTSLEFIPMGGLARTDAASVEIIASKAFTGSIQVNDSGFTDMRDYTDIAVYFLPTDITGQTNVEIFVYWSDDGSTIPFGTDDYSQLTDFNITANTDGTYQPKTYSAKLTTGGGELAAGKGVHLTFPKGGGACKVGVLGTANGTSRFSVRVQRLVR